MIDNTLPPLRSRTEAPTEFSIAEPQQPVAAPVTPSSTGDVFKRLEEKNHLWPTFQRAIRDRGEVDLDFINGLSVDGVSKDLKARGLPDTLQYRTELYRSQNVGDYEYKIGRIAERDELERELIAMGGKGLALEIASYATDPVALALDIAAGGLGKGTTAIRFLTGGARAAGVEGIIQLGLTADDEDTDPHDIAMAVGSGFILGGGMGAAFGRRLNSEQAGRESLINAINKSRDDPGVFDTSAGAAENKLIPQNITSVERTPDLQTLRGSTESVEELGKLGFRFDGTANMWKRAKDNVAQKKIVQKLFPSFILQNKRAVDNASAVEIAERFVGAQEVGLRNETNSLFRSWLESAHGQGRWKQAMTSTFNGGKRISLEEDFNEMVGTIMQREIAHEERWLGEVRQLRRTAGDDFVAPPRPRLDHPDMPKEALDAAEAYFKRFKAMDDELVARGIRERPEGLPGVPERTRYLPRKLSREKGIGIRTRIAGDGQGEITALIADSIRRGRANAGLDVDDELTDAVAKAYAKRLTSAKDIGERYARDIDFLEEMDKDFIEDLLVEGGAAPEEIAHVMDVLERGLKKNNVAADADAPARLKHRLTLDLDTAREVRFKDGTTGEITMRDFFENNADDLFFNYTRWAGGEVGLNRVGMDSHSLDKIIKEAGVEAGSLHDNPALFTREQYDDLVWMRDRVMGRSLNSEFSPTHVRAARAATGIGFITRMGSAWWNAAVESGTILASNSMARILKRMPAFNDILRNLRGKNPDAALVRQLSMWDGGIGETMKRGVFSSRHEASEAVMKRPNLSTKGQKTLAGIEDRIEGLKRGAAYTNLLGHVTDVTRQFSSIMGLDTLDDILVRGAKPPSWWSARAASWSLDEGKMARLGAYLKSDAVKRGKFGEIVDLGNAPLEVQDIMGDFLFRYTGEQIQHVVNGSLPRWMQKYPIMRVLSQFRSFTTAAWTKHTLKDIHFADALAAQKFVITGGLASLAYMARTTVDYAGTDEYEKRMTPAKVIAGGVNYAVSASLLPAAVDTVAPVFGIDAPFAQARTSGLSAALISGDFNETPIGKYAKDAGTLAKYAGGNLTSLVTGDGLRGPSKAELRSATNVAMIQSLWFLKPLETRAIEHFGSDDRQESIDIWETLGIDK